MMTLLVRRQAPGGGKVSTFHRFAGSIVETYGEASVHLIVHGVVTEKAEDEDKPLEFELPDGDVAHVVSSDGATVTTFKWKPPFALNRGGNRRAAAS